MSIKTIHVVFGIVEYEGATAICAFEEKEEADAFAELCTAYNTTRPPYPDLIEDTPENDAWRKAHPAPDATWVDRYSVHSLELHLTKPRL